MRMIRITMTLKNLLATNNTVWYTVLFVFFIQ